MFPILSKYVPNDSSFMKFSEEEFKPRDQAAKGPNNEECKSFQRKKELKV